MSPSGTSADYPLIARELEAGERVLWSGQPDPARLFRRAIPGALFFLLVMAYMAFWIGFATTSLRKALAAGRTSGIADILVLACCLIVVALAVGMMLSPWLERAQAPRTFYALTDRRALIVVEGRKRAVKSVLPAEFALERRDLPNGQGDVIFKRAIIRRISGKTTPEIGFYGIANAQEVERMAGELAGGAR